MTECVFSKGGKTLSVIGTGCIELKICCTLNCIKHTGVYVNYIV